MKKMGRKSANICADSEFDIYIFLIWIFIVVVYNEVNKLVEITMNLETCYQMLIEVNKYAESEFRFHKFVISIFNICSQIRKKSA